MVSPELLLNDGRFDVLWGKNKFTNKIINIVLDEAHVIKEWGGTFRSDYLRIGPIRYLLPRTVPFHLGSATISLQLEPILQSNLHLRQHHTSVIRMSTDRPNIFLVVKRMKYPLNSFEDLAFIIQKHLKPGDPKPPKFLVFFNSRTEAQAGGEYLRQRLSPELRDKVKWFHSGMTDEFREDETYALIIGEALGDAATDAIGMVCFY